MQEIINIEKANINGAEVNSANSRDIYKYLEVKQGYSDWMKYQISKLCLVEDVDFTKHIHVVGKNRLYDYVVTSEVAKNIGLISFTVKGQEIRDYFIQCEKDLNKPLSFEEMAKQTILIADKRIKELELKIESDKPLVAFGSAIAQSSATVKIGDWIKAVNDSGDIDMGRNKAFKWLRENKYLTKDNMPMQQYVNNGLFEVKEGLVVTDTRQIATFTTLLTGKGQMYFAKKLKEVA